MKPGDQTHDTEEKGRPNQSGAPEKWRKRNQDKQRQKDTPRQVSGTEEKRTDGETQRNRIRKRVPEFRPGGGVEG